MKRGKKSYLGMKRGNDNQHGGKHESESWAEMPEGRIPDSFPYWEADSSIWEMEITDWDFEFIEWDFQLQDWNFPILEGWEDLPELNDNRKQAGSPDITEGSRKGKKSYP